MSLNLRSWAPAGILAVGLVLVQGVSEQKRMPLEVPLDRAIPASIAGLTSQDIEIPAEEQAVAGMSSYVMRLYGEPGGAAMFSLYVGYYESQMQGRTIHSPRNCMPGAGWEALDASYATIETATGPVTVNRYMLQNGAQRALALYWYQGRGRVAASEYAVKWDLLRDAALHGRSEEALVRILVPVATSEQAAFKLAASVAGTVIPAVEQALPAFEE